MAASKRKLAGCTRRLASKRRQRQGGSAGRRVPLWFERLEERLALSFTVTTTADNGDDTLPTIADPTGPIPGSLREAILLANEAGGGGISFNIPGAGLHVLQPPKVYPPLLHSVTIDGYTQPGSTPNSDPSGFNAVINIRIDGDVAVTNVNGSSGLRFLAGGNTVRGLNITRFPSGVSLAGGGGSVLEGNLFGTDAEGSTGLGNSNNITIGDGGNRIGGADPAQRNVSSGASNAGILVTSLLTGEANTPFNNEIVGNFIGTNPAGTAGVAGQGTGIYLTQNAQGTHIGGPNPGERNIISGNRSAGILFANAFHQIVQGNYIGVDATGTTAIPNTGSGAINVGHLGATGQIGGDEPGEGNLISGNAADGIAISNSNNLVIEGNRIGVDANGAPLGNGRHGINHANGAGTLIRDNLIAHNGIGTSPVGINLRGGGSGVRVQGNEIRNNAGDGISASSLPGAPRKLIGGRAPGEGNIIAANGLRGVNVSSGVGIEIVGNSMVGNGRLGIGLGGGGIAPAVNDATDADTGPNQLQNYPVLTVAESQGSLTHVAGSLTSIFGSVYKLDFYAVAIADATSHGEGFRYLGTLDRGVGSFSGTLDRATLPGEFLSATATDANGNTSEFARNFVIRGVPHAVELIPDLVVGEDAGPVLDYADLNHVFHDADDPDSALTYSLSAVTPAGIVSAAIDENDRLDLSFLADQHGMATITVRATDPGGRFGEVTFQVLVNPVADTPSVTGAGTAEDTQSTAGLVVSPNPGDGAEVTHLQISGITGGLLFHQNGVSPIHNGEFITVAAGAAGLRFTPHADLNTPAGDTFAFQIQASTSDAIAGLGGEKITASITVSEVNDAPVGIDDELGDLDTGISLGALIPFAKLLDNDLSGPPNESGQPRFLTAVDSAVGGIVRIAGPATVQFLPAPGFIGISSFRYHFGDVGTTAGASDSQTGFGVARFNDPRPAHVYVDDNWAGTQLFDDPDGDGPARFFGFDAFAAIQPALDMVTTSGRVSVAAGQYLENLTVSRDVSLEGIGAAETIVTGSATAETLTVNAGTTNVVLSGITLRHAVRFVVTASGVRNDGTLRLHEAVVRDNGGIDGGGIANFGDLTITASTIHDNVAANQGGGVWNAGRLNIDNSTLSGNTANLGGGAVYMNGGAPSRVTRSTITANRSAAGAIAGVGVLELQSTIVAETTTLFDVPAPDLFGLAPVSGGHNLIGSNASALQAASGDQIGPLGDPLDPMLEPLADNGGPTPTHALRRGSPAIDRGDAAGATGFDQRGERRIEDGDGNRVRTIDIGAYEKLAPHLTIVPLTGRVKKVDDGVPDSDVNDPDLMIQQSLFSEPHVYSAHIALRVPDPLVGPVVFEVRREGVLINRQELEPDSDGIVRVSYENAQPGVDVLEARATLGEFHAHDSDLAYWNPPESHPKISLKKTTLNNLHRILAPTMAEQVFAASLSASTGLPDPARMAGHEVTLHAFNNHTDELALVGSAATGEGGTATIMLTRQRVAVEELVAAVEFEGQQFFANTPVSWVVAPPTVSFEITRPDPLNVKVVATLSRDLDPTDADDRLNPPVPFHPFDFTFSHGGLPATTTRQQTDQNGKFTYTYQDLFSDPDKVNVKGSLVTHVEGAPPNESFHVVEFDATTLVLDTVDVEVRPPSQGLPTREPIIGGLFSASFPSRATIDVLVTKNGFALENATVYFKLDEGPHIPHSGATFSAVSDATGHAVISFLNQNEFDLFDGNGDEGIDEGKIYVAGITQPLADAEVRWFPSVVSGPQSTAFEWLLVPGFAVAMRSKPWVHVDLAADPALNQVNPAGPVKVRHFDPLLVTSGVTYFHEITGENLPEAPQGFAAGNPTTGQAGRYYEIESTVDRVTDLIPSLVFIHKNDFPDGFQAFPAGPDKIFHAKDGAWEPLDTFDGGIIAAIDGAVDLLFDLRPDVISNVIAGIKAVADFAGSEMHHYWVAITDSFSPFAIFMATGAPTGNSDAYALTPESVLRVTASNGVLANDTDSDSSMTAELVVAPLHGALVFSADGSFEYTPEPGFVGEDSFVYRPLDDVHLGSLTNVTLFVTPDPLSVSASLDRDSILENDTATIRGAIAGPPTTGVHEVEIDWEGDGAFDELLVLPPGVWNFSASRTYLDNRPSPGNGTPFDDYTVTIRIGDNSGNEALQSETLHVENVAPIAAITGPGAAEAGQTIAFVLVATDAPADQAAGFTFAIDWDEDDIIDEIVSGHSGMMVTHRFTEAGSHEVAVIATDKDSGQSDLATHVLQIGGVTGGAGAVELVGNDLVITGSDGDDLITVRRNRQGAGVVVRINGVRFGPYAPSGLLIARGLAGDDRLRVGRHVTLDAVLDGGVGDDVLRGGAGNDHLLGGEGNDELIATRGDDLLEGGLGNDLLRGGIGHDFLRGEGGNDLLRGGEGDDRLDGGSGHDELDGQEGADRLLGAAGDDSLDGGSGDDLLDGGEGVDSLSGHGGNDILVGGAGNDLLIGGQGRDLLIGGFGEDHLVGNADEDILIAGYTNYDADNQALLAIHAEWTRGDASYAERVGHLRIGGGLNGGVNLGDTTVHDDTACDLLTGSAGRDWLFANLDGGILDLLTDDHANEFENDID